MLNIRAPLNALLGYGHAAVNIIKALDIPLSVMPIGQPHLTTNDAELFQALMNERFERFSIDNKSLTIWHENMLFDALPSKKETVGFPFFELDIFDVTRKKGLSCVDRLFVSSKWGQQVLKNNGFSSDVVPLGVDSTIFSPKANTSGPYRFFTIGKIEERKCTRFLADIFGAAFTMMDNVEFHIMCDSILPPIHNQMGVFREMMKNSVLGDKITIHSVKSTDYDLADFIRSMDCGVFMTRAEGWGLPILQSMACGKPVITTNYSAQTEFCTSENAHLVEIDGVEPAFDGLWFDGRCGNWATIGDRQIDQCVEYMRKCYTSNVRHNQAGVETATKFSWQNTASIIKGHLGL